MKSLSNFIAESSERVDESFNVRSLLNELFNEVVPENYDEESDPEWYVSSKYSHYYQERIEEFREESNNKKNLIPSYVSLYYAVVHKFYAEDGFIPEVFSDINSFVQEQAGKFRLLDERIEKVLPKNYNYGRQVMWENIKGIIKNKDVEPETVKELLDFFAEEIDHYL